MKTHLIKAAILATGMVVLTAGTEPTVAANINSSGTFCQNFNAAQVTDIDYLASGVRNLNVNPRAVICSVPRSPLAAGATSGVFFVDGRNTGGASTTCTLSSFNFNGTFLGSTSFTSAAATYNQFLSLPSAQLGTFAYVSVLCTLPGNANGVLFGVTSFQ